MSYRDPVALTSPLACPVSTSRLTNTLTFEGYCFNSLWPLNTALKGEIKIEEITIYFSSLKTKRQIVAAASLFCKQQDWGHPTVFEKGTELLRHQRGVVLLFDWREDGGRLGPTERQPAIWPDSIKVNLLSSPRWLPRSWSLASFSECSKDERMKLERKTYLFTISREHYSCG